VLRHICDVFLKDRLVLVPDNLDCGSHNDTMGDLAD
jgi:hypothetical protein